MHPHGLVLTSSVNRLWQRQKMKMKMKTLSTHPLPLPPHLPNRSCGAMRSIAIVSRVHRPAYEDINYLINPNAPRTNRFNPNNTLCHPPTSSSSLLVCLSSCGTGTEEKVPMKSIESNVFIFLLMMMRWWCCLSLVLFRGILIQNLYICHPQVMCRASFVRHKRE